MQYGLSQFSWTITNGECSSSDTVSVEAFRQASVTLSADTSICPNTAEVVLNANVQGGLFGSWSFYSGSGSFSNDTAYTTTVSDLIGGTGANVVVYTVNNGLCGDSDTLIINVYGVNDAPCLNASIFIPEGFSPDDDGVHDKFVISGLNGKHLTLKVFNRSGGNFGL